MAFETYGFGGKTPEYYQKDFGNKDLLKEYSYEELWATLFDSEDSPIPHNLTDKHRVVIVDADAIVFRTSVACETRGVVATLNGKERKFKTKTKLKAHCNKVGIDFDSVEFENTFSIEPIEDCFESLGNFVSKIHRQLNATHVVFFLGGSINFRHDIKLPTKYKENRKGKDRPRYLEAARQYLIKHYDTYVVSGIEADDIVQGVTSHIINNTDAYAAAYQIDKDFHTSMTPNRYWHIGTNELIELQGGLGSLEKPSNDVKGEGLMWVLFQLMLGDPSDGYSPKVFYKPKFRRKYGETSYYNDFKDFDNEQELLVAWVNKWGELLPEVIEFDDFNGTPQKHNWLSLAEIYFQCLYMKMSPKDDTTFEKLLGRYGITVDSETGYIHTTEVDLPKTIKKPKKVSPVKESTFGFGW